MDLVCGRTKKIPSKSWGRECSLCSSRHGVPIECSARGCKESYHTTCAIRGKLKMQAIFAKNFKGGIKLRSYCRKHSPSIVMVDGELVQSDKIDASGVKEIDMTNLADDREQNNEELDRFWKYVDLNEVHRNISHAYAKASSSAKSSEESDHEPTTKKVSKKGSPSKSSSQQESKKLFKKMRLMDEGKRISQESAQEVDPLMLDLIYRYWMLLRTANNGQSLIKFSPMALKERENEQRKSILKLRIELERVRNLSYMIGKREKLKAAWWKTHQNIIMRTFSVINDLNPPIDATIPKSPDISLNGPQTSSHHQSATFLTNGKKSLHPTQYLQPSNGIFDERDQLINDLITCDRIYDSTLAKSNSTHNNLSDQERSTMERRRTLSLVRRINRQLKSVSVEPPMNPYAKSYLALKRNDSPVSQQQQQHQTTTSNKAYKYR